MTEQQDIHCERCGEKLNPYKAVWLDLNWRTHKYAPIGKTWPEADSQGGFPFGAACARSTLQSQHLTPAEAQDATPSPGERT